jgi:hypothetical protein
MVTLTDLLPTIHQLTFFDKIKLISRRHINAGTRSIIIRKPIV